MATEQEINEAQKTGTQLEKDDEGRETAPITANPVAAVLTRQQEKNPFIDSKIYNPNQIHMILKNAERGEIGPQLNMFQRMKEQDSSLASAVQTRRLTLRRAKTTIVPPPGFEEDPAAIFAVDYLNAVLPGIEGYAGIHPLLVDGAIDGFKALEIEWRGTVPVALHETPNDGWRWYRGGLQYQDINRLWQDVPPDKFLIYSPRGNSPEISRRGVMRTLSYIWVLKHYANRDWASFVEVFGMPTIVAKVPADWEKGDSRLTDIEEALGAMGSDGYGIFNEELDLEAFASGVGGGGSPHPKFLQWCDQQIAKAILGQTLTSDTTGRTGSYALGKIHNEVRLDISQADVDGEDEAIRRDLFAPIIFYGLGPDAIVPVQVSQIEDTEQELRDAGKLDIAVNKLGLPVPQSEAYRLLRIRPPEEGEEILAGEAVAAPADPFTGAAEAVEQTCSHTAQAAYQELEGNEHDEMTMILEALANFSTTEWTEVQSQFVMNDVLAMTKANPDLTLEEAIERLPALYPDLPVEAMQNAIAETMNSAAANGDLKIDAEAGHPAADRVEGVEREKHGEGSDHG